MSLAQHCYTNTSSNIIFIFTIVQVLREASVAYDAHPQLDLLQSNTSQSLPNSYGGTSVSSPNLSQPSSSTCSYSESSEV